jgi:hypothetical protein
MDALFGIGYEISDTDMMREEILEPLAKIYSDYKKGAPLYPCVERYNKTLKWIESESPYLLSHIPDWKEVAEYGMEAFYPVFLEEDKAWTIMTDNPVLGDAILLSKGHGYDPYGILADIKHCMDARDTVILIDWYSSAYVVVSSPFVGNRLLIEPDVGCRSICDAEQGGTTETFILSPEIEAAILEEFEQEVRYSLFSTDKNKRITDEEIAEKIIDEFGYIPGTLDSRSIGVPDYPCTSGLGGTQASAY